uniref:Aprataxin and PNKP like factor n=1 Tax=Anolis carolinensis TaxID=28377 RepID=G1KVU9_ANOCA|nr:PREDICTED: aprataxin and PNK-like factor isoform X1 [Anolis carolinensis]|eukprot:XP_016851194.1 PREDICTED: aprataxin and PNK-like factor isoform X1 [Anolis carolinensis]
MPGFALAPVEGGRPLELPPGETVLGRGALLGVTDKRVSRKHAILKVAGNHLSIKPVHVNPCFYQPTENGQISPLDIDKWHQLSPGDRFSLLVDKYAFKVLFAPLEVETQRKHCHFLVEDIPNQTSSVLQPSRMPHQQDLGQQSTPSKNHQLLETHLVLEKAAETPKKFSVRFSETKEVQPAEKRKRVLPTWMLQADPSPSASVSGTGNGVKIIKDSGKKRKMSENEDTPLITVDMPGISEELVRELERNESKVQPQKAGSSAGQFTCLSENEEVDFSPQNVRTCQLTETNITGAVNNSWEDDSFKTEQFSQDRPSQSLSNKDEIQELPQINQITKTDISNLNRSQNVLQNSNISIHQRRRACQYGKNCYRKNPIHFQQFSHPGDNDYPDTEVVAETENDNKPECPYGTACYRKNPQHKLEYKHTAPPGSEKRQLRAKSTKKGKGISLEDSDDDGEPNEYDLNDSFIDDDEEEEECEATDEDSDWEPDFQDQDNEDLDTLLKEAQDFAKTKQ